MGSLNFKLLILISLVLLFTACSPVSKQSPEDTGRQAKGENKGMAAGAPAKSKKLFLFENNIQINDRELIEYGQEIHYPEIEGLLDKDCQDRINADIKGSITSYITELQQPGRSGAENEEYAPLISHSHYSVYGNYNNILSLCQYFNISAGNYHETRVKTFTYNLNNGERLKLSHLFIDGADYRGMINRNITEQILRKNYDEQYLCRPFDSITESQHFYIRENEIVICFEQDKQVFYSPRSPGVLEFPIPFGKLEGTVDIYDKYRDPSKKLYATDKVERKWLPNELEVLARKLTNSKNRYVMEAHYIEIRGLENSDFEEEINSAAEERARSFINDEKFIKESEELSLQEDAFAYKNRFASVSGNFAGKLCILERDSQHVHGKDPVHWVQAYCYDIKKGRQFTLGGLLSKYPGYREKIVTEVQRQLLESGYSPQLLESFASLEKAAFFFDEKAIYFYIEGADFQHGGFHAMVPLSHLGEDYHNIFTE